jgi:hypothetical protein
MAVNQNFDKILEQSSKANVLLKKINNGLFENLFTNKETLKNIRKALIKYNKKQKKYFEFLHEAHLSRKYYNKLIKAFEDYIFRINTYMVPNDPDGLKRYNTRNKVAFEKGIDELNKILIKSSPKSPVRQRPISHVRQRPPSPVRQRPSSPVRQRPPSPNILRKKYTENELNQMKLKNIKELFNIRGYNLYVPTNLKLKKQYIETILILQALSSPPTIAREPQQLPHPQQPQQPQLPQPYLYDLSIEELINLQPGRYILNDNILKLMTVKKLRAFAKKRVNLKGATKKTDIIERIKTYFHIQ